MPDALEVAVVPDFAGEIPLAFQARTLFVLASRLGRFGDAAAAAFRCSLPVAWGGLGD